jgi:hypothetical protein
MEDDNESTLPNIFKTVLKDLKNDDIIINIKGLNDLIPLREHFSDKNNLIYFEKTTECIGFILQKLCVRPDNIDDLEIEYNLHKKVLSYIENIVISSSEILSIAASEIFMERLVDIIEYFSLVIGNIGRYEISIKKIQKFTIISDCLYSILLIFASLFNSPKLFKLSFATLNKSSSFHRLIAVIGETLVKDYGYATQEKMLEIICRMVMFSKDKNIVFDPNSSNMHEDLQRQFESYSAKHIYDNRRSILQEINKSSNPQMDSIEIVKFFVEITNKKSKKRSTKEYLTRSIEVDTWLDLTAIDLVIEVPSSDELIRLPLSKLDSSNINRTNTQLRFVCSEIDEALWRYLNEEETILPIAEVIFGIEVGVENSTALNSMYIKLDEAVKLLKRQQDGNLTRSMEKVSIASMTDVETPSHLLQTRSESIPLLGSDENENQEFALISPIKIKEKKQRNPRKELSKQQSEFIIDKKLDTKKSNVGVRRSPRTSPEQKISKISEKKQPVLEKSKKTPAKASTNEQKPDIFDFDEEDDKDDKFDQPPKKRKQNSKELSNELRTKPSELEKEEQIPAKKAPMRAPSVKIQEQKQSVDYVHESIQPKAKMRQSGAKSSKHKESSSSSTDSDVKAVEVREEVREETMDTNFVNENIQSRSKMRQFEAKSSRRSSSSSSSIDSNVKAVEVVREEVREEIMGIEYGEEVGEEIIEERFMQSHYKLRKEARQDEVEDSFSYEFTSQALNDIGENEDELQDADQNIEVMGTITDVSDDDVSEDKDDIIMPLVKELMVIQEKRVAKKRIKKMEELLTTATQQVIGYCDSWKKSSVFKSPNVTIDTKSTKEMIKELFSKFDRDLERINQEQIEIQDIAKNIVKDEKELKNDIKQLNSFIKNETDTLKSELKKRKSMLVEEISKKVVPPSKSQKTTNANDFIKKFKSKYA